jgi:hypothetical protein
MNAPWNGTSGITYEGEITGSSGSFSYTFQKASITCIWINPDPEGVSGQNPARPDGFFKASPNPFRESVELRYSLNEPLDARIEIFNITGRLVRSFEFSDSAGEGFYSAVWDRTDSNGTTVPSGIYFARFTAPGLGLSEPIKLILI